MLSLLLWRYSILGKKNQKEDANKKKTEEYGFKEIVVLGKCYLDAAQKCNEPKIECVGWNHHLLIPIITNMAFACELFLKAILKHNNNDSKGIRTHKLINLFEELQEDIKKEIMNSENEEDFRIRLDKVSNYFYEFRYLYEYYPSSIEYKFLCDFSEKLLKVVDKME